jgi:adenylate cyclase
MTACPRCQTPLQPLRGTAKCPTCGFLLQPQGEITAAPPGAEARPRFVVRDATGRTIEFPIEGPSVIGRSAGVNIQVPDREVSRRHTAIEPENGSLVLKDLGSSNGTFLNGRRVYAPTALRDGDEVMVGNTRLVFRSGGPPPQVLRTTEQQAAVLAAVESFGAFAPAEKIRDVSLLKRDYERLRIAHEFQHVIRLEKDLHALLGRILDVAFDLIPAENGVILLRDDRTNELAVEAVRQRKPDGARVLISETLLAHVANRREGVLTSDAIADDRFNAAHSIIGLGVRSCMAVPLLTGSEVRGVMFLDSREHIGAFTPKDLDVLSAVAAQATVAIENSELLGKVAESAQKRAFLERFLSPALASEVENGRIELTKGGTLQELTILFSDIRGFTTMSEHSPPQETVSMLNEYFELMADCVFSYNGIVDKFIGDAVMALFGAPMRGPDDAERAIRCAMLMMQKTHEFNALRATLGRAPIKVGIGLHTGEAVVGVIGSTKRLEYTAVGDTVNVASRLCSVAGPDEIVLSDVSLGRAGAQRFPCEPLPPLQVKGRAAHLNTFRIRG